jgi:hypothetical protein
MRQARFAVLVVCTVLMAVRTSEADTLRVQVANRSRSVTAPAAAEVTPAGAPGDSPRNVNHAVWTHTKGETPTDTRPPIHLLGETRDAGSTRPGNGSVPVQPVGGFSHYPFGYYGSHGRYPGGAAYYSYGSPARPYPSVPRPYVPRQYGSAIRSNAVVPEDPNGLGERAEELTGTPHPLAGPYGVTVGGSPVGYPGYGPLHVLPFGYGWNGYGWGGYGAYLGTPYGFPAYGAAGYARWNYGPWMNTAPIGVPYYYQYAW